jgi:hypothetical protein
MKEILKASLSANRFSVFFPKENKTLVNSAQNTKERRIKNNYRWNVYSVAIR